ncbi:MAG: transketolase [Anaerolineae bacterium]|nr:transketolase [Anaerolineae bacterium]
MAQTLQERAINTIRFLSVDAVQKASSGHPGLPMGVAAIAYTLWMWHLRVNPANPRWCNRDRFILSGGHGSMLLYSLLHLSGFNLTLEDIKNFRQWGSRTPGHPEYGLTSGVETTTGPLGQGFTNGVGMAIAEAHLSALFNRPGHTVVDHFTYGIVTDGDLMEGVASEAASLAGHLKLGKLIYLYDDNRISIDGSTDLSFTEDRAARFRAYGWHVSNVVDGNDVEAIDKAIKKAKKDARPSLIICRTQIGKGLPTKQGTAKAHGEPAGEQEIAAAKAAVNWSVEPFFIAQDVRDHFHEIAKRGGKMDSQWQKKMAAYEKEFPVLASELERRLNGQLPDGWEQALPQFDPDPVGMATRAASGKVINALAGAIPEMVGGSADLTPSNNTWMANEHAFQADTPEGRYIHFGVREHAMGAVINGMALHGGIIPYGATFLVFSDYMRPAIRLSALSHMPSIWIYTHDSIGLGEDGPTHQPVEHLAALRAIPNLVVIRPADANETSEAWRYAIAHRDGPTTLVFSRQALPVLDRQIYASAEGLWKGAYILKDLGVGRPQLILIASGSEVPLIIEAGNRLAAQGVNVRLVSMPSWELFSSQPQHYRDAVLPPDVPARIAIEAGVAQGWEKWVGDKGRIISMTSFGASAPGDKLMQEFGFSVPNLLSIAEQMIGFLQDDQRIP